MNFKTMTYKQKYNYVIMRLRYAMPPELTKLDDFNDEELITWVCEDLATFLLIKNGELKL